MLANYWLISLDALLDKDGMPKRDALVFTGFLLERGIPFAVLTNQTAHSRQTVGRHMSERGFSFPYQFLYTSAMAAVDYALEQDSTRTMAGYLGTSSLRSLLKEAGLSVDLGQADWLFIGDDPQGDLNEINYALRLLEGGAGLIICDGSLRQMRGRERIIGAGALGEILGMASGKKPVLTGFPSGIFIRQALKFIGGNTDNTIVVGASALEVRAASEAGVRSAWMINEDSEDGQELLHLQPSYVFEDFMGLLR